MLRGVGCSRSQKAIIKKTLRDSHYRQVESREPYLCVLRALATGAAPFVGLLLIISGVYFRPSFRCRPQGGASIFSGMPVHRPVSALLPQLPWLRPTARPAGHRVAYLSLAAVACRSFKAVAAWPIC